MTILIKDRKVAADNWQLLKPAADGSPPEVPPAGDVIEKLIDLYLARRDSEAERFVDVVRRIGIEPFKEHVYGGHHQRPAHRDRHVATA